MNYKNVLFLFLITCFLFAGQTEAQDRVKIDMAGDGQQMSSISARFYKDIDFVKVRELADLLEARTYYNSLAKKMVLYLGNHKVKVTAFNPFVMIDDAAFQMPIGTDFDADGIWVPLDYFVDLIAVYSPTPISYDRNTHTLALVYEGQNILAINVEEKVNGTLIRILTKRKFDLPNLARRVSQGWLYIDVYGGRVDPAKIGTGKANGIVRKIVALQHDESAQLSFRLRKEVEREDISVSSSDHEVLVSVRTSKVLPENYLVDLEQERKKYLIDKIIIDPGHGGKDPGTVGYGKLKEKDVVLNISKMLKNMLEKRLDVEVLMTRDSDRAVALRERSAFANRHGGKLFISVHANAVKDRSAKGVETWCLGVGKSKSDRAIAEKENSVIRYEDSWEEYNDLTDDNYILLAMAQNAFNQESHNLAAAVQKELPKAIGSRNRGVKQANFYVLVGTSMPKILVEVGFISNPSEGKKLKKREYQEKVAERIFAGVKNFKESSEKEILGSLVGGQE
jgi:N-acetylmuramoyl-L-alanine amidase